MNSFREKAVQRVLERGRAVANSEKKRTTRTRVERERKTSLTCKEDMSGKKFQTAEDLVAKGNSLFVDEQYDEALEAYTGAIELEDDHFEAYLKRSAAHYSLKNYAGTCFYLSMNQSTQHIYAP